MEHLPLPPSSQEADSTEDENKDLARADSQRHSEWVRGLAAETDFEPLKDFILRLIET